MFETLLTNVETPCNLIDHAVKHKVIKEIRMAIMAGCRRTTQNKCNGSPRSLHRLCMVMVVEWQMR